MCNHGVLLNHASRTHDARLCAPRAQPSYIMLPYCISRGSDNGDRGREEHSPPPIFCKNVIVKLFS